MEYTYDSSTWDSFDVIILSIIFEFLSRRKDIFWPVNTSMTSPAVDLYFTYCIICSKLLAPDTNEFRYRQPRRTLNQFRNRYHSCKVLPVSAPIRKRSGQHL